MSGRRYCRGCNAIYSESEKRDRLSVAGYLYVEDTNAPRCAECEVSRGLPDAPDEIIPDPIDQPRDFYGAQSPTDSISELLEPFGDE